MSREPLPYEAGVRLGLEVRPRLGDVPPQADQARAQRRRQAALPREECAVDLRQLEVGHERFEAQQRAQAHRAAPRQHDAEEEHGVPRPAPGPVEVVEDAPQRPPGRRRPDDLFLHQENGLAGIGAGRRDAGGLFAEHGRDDLGLTLEVPADDPVGGQPDLGGP